jgi:hypothetical protein
MARRVVLLVIASAVALVSLSGCEAIMGVLGIGDDPTLSGSIAGVARYVNKADDSGIVVSLELVQAARTVSFDRAVASRSASARVLADQTTTRADGSFSFDAIPPGTYTVYASSADSAEGAVRTNVTVEADSRATAGELQLTATGSISGTVVNGATGEGEAGWIVGIADTSYLSITGSAGRFTISGVPAASTPYQVIAVRGDAQFTGFTAIVNAGIAGTMGNLSVTSRPSVAWLAGNGQPAAAGGEDGDFYLDLDASTMYQKNAGAWSVVAELGDLRARTELMEPMGYRSVGVGRRRRTRRARA